MPTNHKGNLPSTWIIATFLTLALLFTAVPSPAHAALIYQPEEKCRTHFAGGKPPSDLNVFKPVSTCHWKDGEVFFYNVYDEGVLHGSITAHLVNHSLLSNSSGRRPFTEDPQLEALGVKQVNPEKSSSGYGELWNRGHLGPNQMFSYDKSPGGAWAQCYYASNIAPQDFQFNQDGWKLLEENIFLYCKNNQKNAYVITGTYYNTSLRGNPAKYDPWDDKNIRRLNSGIGIPDYYYKVICDGKQSAAFAGRNMLKHSGLESLQFMTVESLQSWTGIDFELPETCKINQVDPKYWNFTYGVKPKKESDMSDSHLEALKLRRPMSGIERINVGPRFSDATIFNGIANFVEVPDSQDGGITKQTEEVLAAVDKTLAKVGSDKSKLLQVTIYLTSMTNYDGFNAVWDKWVTPGATPSRACIQVAGLARAGWLLEVVCVAAVTK